jgi:phenylpropionate dioxygenase-like ring-hydroxylating dioxygenase large terminal subunit
MRPENISYNYQELIQADRIHSSLYADPSIFHEEMQKIFYSGWVFVGHASEIPNAGDYVRRLIGLEPVLFLRKKDGQVDVVANRCAHRGNMLCHEEKGNTKAFSCVYHGWTFDLDGTLLDVPSPKGFPKPFSALALDKPAHIASYRGFYFATFNPNAMPFETYLGHGFSLIDRACDISPVGEINLTAGWVKQQFKANWKMLPENDTDGYHVNFVHLSFVKAIRSQYDTSLMAPEEEVKSVTRDWGGGHTEIDFAPSYTQEMEWLGTTPEKCQEYIKALEQAYGYEKAHQIAHDGPPHAIIFPNLFLAEGNIVIFQPLGPNTCVQYHTPMLLKGVPDALNARIIRQSEAALGPSAFLLADDAVVAERTQMAISARGGWLDLSRGLNRERKLENGVIESHLTDETTNRGFWHHYRRIMMGAI